MPLQKKFDSAPYYDDYSESKDYYKILFKPGVAVQARELNQLQTMLQKQIERFGDHIFKSGTVVSGINFTYNAALDYVKILDVEADGRPVAPGSYVGLFARNTSNLVASILSSRDGYESRDPDLNTLYLNYINSGNSYTESTFSNSAVLTIYSPSYPLYGITIDSPGLDFANSDDVIITSAVKVLLLSNTKFQNTEVITQSTSGATLEIVEAIDDVSNTEMQVLLVKPRNSDLANTSESSSKWSLQTALNIVGGTSTATARVEELIGSGARGIATTDTLGIVRVITIASPGSGYTYVPHVTIRPTAVPTADLSNLDLVARNYKGKVTVAGSGFTAPVGQAYSFGVTEGVIYQKGYFSRVTPQTVIVSNYSNQPDGLVVGFTTDESNVGVTSDSSLYDNAANTTNYRAPGADRLKLYPTLKVIANTAAKANTTFFPLVEFQDGQASREYRDTQYNTLGQEFERRTKESAGDYVIDPFIVTSKEITGNTTHFSALIDPGTAYIDGARIKTINNTYIPVRKVSETVQRENTILTASYGNFVRVKELVGNFDFKTGGTVDLYNTAVAAATNLTAPTTGGGTKIGTARVRSLVHEIGDQGLPSVFYKMYLFDIQMSQGNTFENVRSIHYDGTNKGVCDAVLRYSTTANRNIALLEDTTLSDSVFDLGVTGVKSISNVAYRYRTSNESLTVATNGTFSISAPSGYEFPYTAGHTLSTSEKQTFTFTPLETLVGSANVSGTFNVSSTSAVITTSSSQLAVLEPGDYIGVYSAPSTYDTRRVVSVNATAIIVNANLSFTNAAASGTIVLPAYVPVNLTKSTRTIATRPGAGGNATVDVDFGRSFVASKSIVGAYNIYIPSATRVSKTVNRNIRVKINTSTHTNGATGPWSLGVPDVIRLRAVYEGTTTSGTDVTKHFFLDDGGKGDAYKLGALVKDPLSSYSTTSKNLLVVFDCFTPSSGLEGFYTINSYPVNDSANLTSSNTTINSLEIPELITTRGYYYDLRNGFDFRPVGANTATLATSDGTANTNPSGAFTLNTDEKFFPVPDSQVAFDSEIYQARSDTVVVRKDGDFGVIEGVVRDVADQRYAPPGEARSMILNRLLVPKYPALPQILSAQTRTFINKSVGNERGIVNKRANAYRVQTTLNGQTGSAVQPKGFTMSRIGSLERRVQVLEQYVSLSRRESAVKDIAIASSIDPTKQRFKNGFVVDNFNASTSADRSNKEFNALVDGALKPVVIPKTLSMRVVSGDLVASNGIFNDALMLPHTEEALVSFVVGTVPYVAPTPSASPIPITPSPSMSRVPASPSPIPETPNPSPTPTPSITPTMSATPTPSPTPSATPSPSPSPTPGASPTPTPSVTPTPTPTPTPTMSATPTPTPSRSVAASPSPSPSPTPTPSATPPASPSASPPASATPSKSMPAGRSTTSGGGDSTWWVFSPGLFISTVTLLLPDSGGKVDVSPGWSDGINLPSDIPFTVTNITTVDTDAVTISSGGVTLVESTSQGEVSDLTAEEISGLDYIDSSIYDMVTIDDFRQSDYGDEGRFGAGGFIGDSGVSFGGGGGGGCPDPTTPIMISPTDSVQAGSIKVGDIIYTMHETTGEYGYFKVNAAEEVQQPKLRFNMVDGTSLVVSTTHRFLTPAGTYEFASTIKAGDMLKKVDTEVAVASIDSVGTGLVIKFEIDQAHTYIAGGFIAHNTKMIFESHWEMAQF